MQGRAAVQGREHLKPVLTTLHAAGDVQWNEAADVMPADLPLVAWLRRFRHDAAGRQAIILRGTVSVRERYRDLIGAVLIRHQRGAPHVVVSDSTIDPGSRAIERRLPRAFRNLVPWASRLALRAADGPHVTWCVLSSHELDTFPATWRVPKERVVFTPFTHTLWGGGENLPTSDGGYVFSGGNSLREYDLLLDAVEGLDVDVDIATTWVPRVGRILSTRTRVGPLSHEVFMQRLRDCRCLVLPLRYSTRSTGQQTYLNAMALGKPVIVTDAPGVLDYIEPGVTGVVVAADPIALRSAIMHTLDSRNADEYATMGMRAREVVLSRFNDVRYRRQLLNIALGSTPGHPGFDVD